MFCFSNLLDIINNAVMNVHVQVFVWTYVSISAVVGWSFLYKLITSCYIMLLKSSISLLIICLVALSIIDSGILKSPAITVELMLQTGCLCLPHIYILKP